MTIFFWNVQSGYYRDRVGLHSLGFWFVSAFLFYFAGSGLVPPLIHFSIILIKFSKHGGRGGGGLGGPS